MTHYLKEVIEMTDLTPLGYFIAVIIGALGAIIYALHVLFALDRRIARMEEHIEKMAGRILKEESRIEKKIKRR